MRLRSIVRRTVAASTVSVVACTLLAPGAVAAPAAIPADRPAQPKNVILMIGDGMGYNYLDLHNAYHTDKVHYQVETGGDHKAISAQTVNSPDQPEGFQRWAQLGMQTNWAEGPSYDPQAAWGDFQWAKNNPTDSAAAGTAMASGVKTYNAGIGVNVDEQRVENVAERAKTLGKAAGVISSVPFSHATPAAFSAHAVSRNDYHGIAAQQVHGDLDVVMGAGHPFYDDDHQLRQTPQYTYIAEEDYTALETGATDFQLIQDDADFEALTEGDTPERVFGIPQVGSTLQQSRAADRGRGDLNDVVDLPTMTAGALNVLDEDEDGFFLMVEGGAIDWTGHANQTERALEETEDFFDSIETVSRWVEENSSWDETLVIVTADHETGYLSGDPGEAFNPMVPQGTGQYPTLSWNSPNHTNQLVPYFLKGAGAEALEQRTIGRDQIRGRYLDNTAMAAWLLQDAWVPGDDPSPEPTPEPTAEPTGEPTADPTTEPTAVPTPEPTVEPTAEPTEESTAAPTSEPTEEPTAQPTVQPTASEAPAVPAVGAGRDGSSGSEGSSTGHHSVTSEGMPASTGLARTGLDAGPWLGIGAGVLVLGSALLLLSRRTRRNS